MKKLLILLALLLSGTLAAYNASSANYSVESFHWGSAGAGNSTRSFHYYARMTTTYQQPSTDTINATNLSGNIGWFVNTPPPGSINVTLGPGIPGVYFITSNPRNLTNISAFRQNASQPLFNVTNTGGLSYLVAMKTSSTTDNITKKCGPNANMTGLVTLATYTQAITTVNAGESHGIWCWVDFGNVGAISGKFNLTVS